MCDEVGVFAFRADDVDYEIGPLSGGKDQGGRLSRALRAVGRRVRSPSHPLESQSEPRRDLRRPILLSHLAVTGLENRVSAILATGTTLATADLRLTVAGTTT